MAKRRPGKPRQKGPNKDQKKPYSFPENTLDKATSETLEERQKDVSKYYWDFITEIEFQRNFIIDELKVAFIEASVGPHIIKEWKRVVRHRYTLKPLSPAGSLKRNGGRFNFSDINTRSFAPFPALYLAEDFDTAMAECQGPTVPPRQPGDPLLEPVESFTNAVINGRLDRIIDLTDLNNFQKILALISDFELPERLYVTAQKYNWAPPHVVTDIPTLKDSLFDPNWTLWPSLYDVPSPSQTFGQMVCSFGIQGIIYQSSKGASNCLAVFTENFKDSESYLELADDEPAQETEVLRIDSDNYDYGTT